ncbi:unnamed protein product, partial [Effrenium voratum]
YMLFLEYSSYLRKQEVTEEEKAERRKQLEPLLKQYGLDNLTEQEQQGSCTWILMACLVLLAATVFYYYGMPTSSSELDMTL